MKYIIVGWFAFPTSNIVCYYWAICLEFHLGFSVIMIGKTSMAKEEKNLRLSNRLKPEDSALIDKDH